MGFRMGMGPWRVRRLNPVECWSWSSPLALEMKSERDARTPPLATYTEEELHHESA